LAKKKLYPIYHGFLLLLDLLKIRASLILSDRLIETLFYTLIIKITSSLLFYKLDIYILRIKSVGLYGGSTQDPPECKKWV
jgi:hypothetical protein